MHSREYFAKRAEQRMQRAHDKATRPMRRINKAYDASIERLRADINRIVGNVDGLDEHEVRRLLTEEISNADYAALLDAYQNATNLEVRKEFESALKAAAARGRISRDEALIDAINRERLSMTDVELKETGDHLRDIYRVTMEENGFTDIPQAVVDEVIAQKWNGANYSARVWKNQEALSNILQNRLYESFLSGKPNREIATEIKDLTDMGRHAANRLIRTETSYVVNSADLEGSKSRGVKAKRFEATLDARTSKACRKHDDIVVPIDKIKIGENAPPLHPYCRSFMVDILEGWDYETEDELAKIIKKSK